MDQVAGLPVLVLSGSHGEMGIDYGKAVQSLIERNVADYLRRFRDTAGLSETDVRRWGEVYREATYSYNTDIAEMIDGIASGSGLLPQYLFCLNARTELLYGTTGKEDACTSIAVLPQVSSNRHPMIGQNWDWHPEQSDLTILLATQDAGEFTVISLTEAGMLAKSGLNSAGIGLCANLLVSDKDYRGYGVPYHILLRGVLESHTMADALRATVNHERVASGNFLIADAEGEAIDLEVFPGDFSHLFPTDGVIVHSNHFIGAVPVRDQIKSRSALTLLRPERARHLLASKIAEKAVSPDDLKRVFRDHYSFPNGICRHIDPRDPDENKNCTAYSVLMDLHDFTFSVAQGPPCEHDYESISLKNLFVH